MKRNCICCDKDILPCFPFDDYNKEHDKFSTPPDDATVWTSVGNFGSTVYDSFGESRLEAYICDDCLKAKAKYVYQYRVETVTEVRDVRQFNPDE